MLLSLGLVTGPCWAAREAGPGLERLSMSPDQRRADRAEPMRMEPLPEIMDEAAPLTEMVDLARAQLGPLLAIRPDLRFVVNGRVPDAARERMAVGLKFARSF